MSIAIASVYCENIRSELLRLQYHLGYPSKSNIRCPIFQQDKIIYIRALPQDAVIPTMPIKSLPLILHDADIRTFLHDNHEGCGWVVKPPFCTNGEGLKFCKTVEKVIQALKLLSRTICSRKGIPYLLLQPCLDNRKEYKVVCLNGHPKYISNHSRGSKGRKFCNEEEVKAFAFNVLQSISHRDDFIINMLCRVDVMTYKGRMVVNELESFEAATPGPRDSEAQVVPFLVEFWQHQLMLLANELMC